MSTAHQSASVPAATHATTASSGSNLTLFLAFACVYIIWGSTFFAIRVGDESFPPLVVAGLRHMIFGALFYPILRWKTGIRPTWEHWRTAIITGFLLLFIGNGG